MAKRKKKSKKAKGARAPAGRKPPAEAESGLGELIDMEQAIRLLKTTRPTFYRWLRAGRIKGMKLGRQWRFYREDVERFLRGEEPRIELRADIKPLIEDLRQRVEALEGGKFTPSHENEVLQAISYKIVLAARMKATDIHIEPQWKEAERENVAVLRYRVDGALHAVAELDLRLLPAVVERWKIMANADVQENRLPQDGRIIAEIEGKKIDMRVCFLPACMGESVTVRILDPTQVSLSLDRIDYAPRDKELLVTALGQPWGTIVLTGPTGSGKTTVLYSCLNRVSGPSVKTVTIEDPVEYFLPHALQVQVMTRAGLDITRAARAALRSDPDVILVGEIRDFETLQIVHQSALTGHLVLTTLHTNEAAGALVRMVEIGSSPFVVADSTKLVISQRLVRKLCRECSKEKRRPEHLALAEELAREGGLDWDALPKGFCEPVGCDECARTGFRGRNVIAEALEVTPRIGAALRKGASVEDLRALAVSQGMTTIAADGIRRAAAGETSLGEVIRVLGLR